MTDPARPVADLDHALAEQLVRDRGLPEMAHLVLAGLVVWLVGDAVPTAVLLPWMAGVAAVVAPRAVLWNVLRRRAWSPRTVTITVRVTMTALGLAWGVGTAVATQFLPLATTAILVMGLAGLLSGGIATLVADRWVFSLYGAAMFAPILLGLGVLADERLEIGAIALIVIFLAFTVRLQRRAQQTLSERLQVEGALREERGRLAEAQGIGHIGSWELDVGSGRVTWSDEAYRLWGVPIGAPIGYDRFLAGVHPEDRGRVERVIGEGLEARRTVEFECRIVRPGGDVRYVFNRNVVVTDTHGRPTRLAGTCLDITDRKLAEENRRTLLEDLQRAVAEVKVLRGILPICAECKRIRTESGDWEAVESFVREHTNAEFSHGLCPDCARKTWG